jgi:hypothetical protein
MPKRETMLLCYRESSFIPLRRSLLVDLDNIDLRFDLYSRRGGSPMYADGISEITNWNRTDGRRQQEALGET